jgi:hypothetical protein
MDNSDIKSYTIINYLFSIYNNNEIDSRGLLKDSIEISLSQWHKQCIINNNNDVIPIILKLFQNLNKNPKKLTVGENSKIKIPDFQSYLSYEWVLSSYKSIITDRYISYDFEVILNTLLLLLNDNLPVIRSKIIKTLSLLISVDPYLILRNNVKDAVTQRFNDMSISVREETVRLVGGFVLKGIYMYVYKYTYIYIYIYIYI